MKELWYRILMKEPPIENGLWTEYINNGKEGWLSNDWRVEETFKDGKLDGISTAYYVNGQKYSEVTFKDGKYDGLWTEWDYNGQKYSESTYKDGKEDGKWTWWWRNGQKKYERTFKDGKLDGLYTSWYEDGQKMEERTFKDGKFDGLWTDWWRNGQKNYERTFKDGKEDGKWTWWWMNGQKKYERTFKDGDGLYTAYYEDGQKMEEGYLHTEVETKMAEEFFAIGDETFLCIGEEGPIDFPDDSGFTSKYIEIETQEKIENYNSNPNDGWLVWCSVCEGNSHDDDDCPLQ